MRSFRYHFDSLWIKIKGAHAHITLSKFTMAFFIFTFLHCFIQGLFQSFLYSIDESASLLVSTVLREAKVPMGNFAWRTMHNGNETVKLCNNLPFDEQTCVEIFISGEGVLPIPSTFRRRSDATITGSAPKSVENLSVQAILNPQGNVTSIALARSNGTVMLDEQCTRVLIYADQVLSNSKREELALIGSEFWMFGLAYFAIIHDSVPHLFAGHFMRMLSAGWTAYAIWRTQDIKERFRVLLTDGACGVDLFPTYFRDRTAFQIPDLTLNVIALVAFSIFVSKLSKTFTNDTFKRVGPPAHVVRLHRLFLAAFVCFQLLVFLILASVSLWIDQLVNGAIAAMSSFTPIYLALFIFTMIVLLPWLVMGHYALRHERHKLMIVFLSIHFVFFSCWALMYYSEVYRWTWIQWPFFASLTVATQLVMLATGIIGVCCWRRFGEGLKHFLHVEATLEKFDFEPDIFPNDLEKKLPSLPRTPIILLPALSYRCGELPTNENNTTSVIGTWTLNWTVIKDTLNKKDD